MKLKVKKSTLIVIVVGILLGIIIATICAIRDENFNKEYQEVETQVEEMDDLYMINNTREELGLKRVTQKEIDNDDNYKIFYVNGGMCIMTNEEVLSLDKKVIEDKTIMETIGW